MSLKTTQNFLARIYTDENLRRAFLSAPEKVGRENGLSDRESGELAQVLPEELSFFAESLFYKRLREVEKLLPLTRQCLAMEFEKHFRAFATAFTPNSIKKHLEDATEFVSFLQSTVKIEPEWIIDVARYEQTRLKFFNTDNRFFFIRFNYDLRRILKELSRVYETSKLNEIKLPPRKTFGVWLRFKGGIWQYFL